MLPGHHGGEAGEVPVSRQWACVAESPARRMSHPRRVSQPAFPATIKAGRGVKLLMIVCCVFSICLIVVAPEVEIAPPPPPPVSSPPVATVPPKPPEPGWMPEVTVMKPFHSRPVKTPVSIHVPAP